MFRTLNTPLTLSLSLLSLSSFATGNLYQKGRETILQQTGCFVVDYSFTETESLKPGYALDERVYDTNSDKTTYELIIPIQKSPNEIRLQHVLFLKDLKTGQVQGLMKHNAEDWHFEAPKYFEFLAPSSWQAKSDSSAGTWTRKITNLDDGLRYQCQADWNHDTFNPEWNCANFAPIPGRETRDMGRKDYNTLDRSTRVIVYKNSWVERQNNVKTIYQNGQKIPLARELGRTWYVRQPESECEEAKAYALQKLGYWKVMMDAWETELAPAATYREKSQVNGLPRFMALYKVEETYSDRLNQNPTIAEEVKQKIQEIIGQYRITE